jgi:hypothetical protein
MAEPRRGARLLPYAALAALVLLFAWRLALTNGILARGDVLLYFYPYWEYRADALRLGRLPLWNPLLFMGAPFLANSQAGVLYPPNWPLIFFPAPTAVKAAVLAHLLLAAAGTYAFGRRALHLSVLGAFTGAAGFALGGYLTAQIEHVNQLQVLAWLPWLLLAAHGLAEAAAARGPGWRWLALRPALALAVVLALQLLAGHTQTVFISAAGAGIYLIVLAATTSGGRRERVGVALAALLPFAAAALLAALLAAAQLLPTLELSGQSLRGGGLPLREALSFSLDPRLLGRALLPGYSRTLFSEFVGYWGVAALVLAVLGLGRERRRLALAALVGVGLLFALGAFNPLYAGLAVLPPFSLFRAPARWLALAALGGALLAGAGVDGLAAATARRRWLALAAPAALMALTPLAAALTPAGETGPLGWPAWADWMGWGLALLAAAALLWLAAPRAGRRSRNLPLPVPTAFAALALVELFGASRVLPFNQLTTPEAYTSVRPALTHLLAARLAPRPSAPEAATTAETIVASSGLVTTVASSLIVPLPAAEASAPPARFLSMSGLRFDPGDLAELRGALEAQLGPASFLDFIVATKHKEVLSPNLPLAWGVPAVDGYDGGVLPLRHYAAFTTLFTGQASPDGRLRENLAAAPDPRLLALVNARYLITDKVRDAWVDGVFYDLEFSLTLPAGETARIAHLPAFQATAIGLVADSFGGSLLAALEDGAEVDLPLTGSRVALPAPARLSALTLRGPITLRGLSLVDERSGAFQSLTLGPYRLAHSGDVKVYEHQAVLPRAFVVPQAVVAADADALALLSSASFDPAQTVILAPDGAAIPPALAEPDAARTAAITRYESEAVTVHAAGPGYLVLTDAYYPGWTATVDGQPAPILRACVMFRAVALPPGEHVVEFRFQPWSVSAGLALSALAWLGLALMWFGSARRRA